MACINDCLTRSWRPTMPDIGSSLQTSISFSWCMAPTCWATLTWKSSGA